MSSATGDGPRATGRQRQAPGLRPEAYGPPLMSDLRDRLAQATSGRYAVEDELGRGGMAVVFAATDARLKRAVAIKALPPDLAFRADVRSRFIREAQMAAGLAHPHIVPIYAVE